MRTPIKKKEEPTRHVQAGVSDKESEFTDVTLVDQELPEEGLPPMSFSSFQNSHGYESNSGRQQTSKSAMPIRNIDRPYPNAHYDPAVYDEGLQPMGLGLSRLQDAIFDLHKYGVDEDFPLPELIVVGDQSAGKSSLIGGLAEIHLPRSGGTCTRCPTFIKTTSSRTPGSSWTCKVSLQKKYFFVRGYNGKFGPWKQCSLDETPAEVTEFRVITDKNELERVLKWAQIAILNPSRDPQEFAGRPESHPDISLEVKFSPNLICLEITGPKLPSLSFYDLPGIIQVADTPNLVTLVGNLIEHYIKHQNALILCALSMANDPATSAAIRLVRKLKAERRCIGVITKPDLLPMGNFDPVWLPLLRGEQDGFRLGYNYYVTKQPYYKPGDSLIEHTTAQDEEEDFFKNHPWSTLSDELRERCGTQKLQMALSQILSKQIRDRLPDLTVAIEKRKSEIDAELQLFPELPNGDVQTVVLQKLSQFSMAVEKEISGYSSSTEFQKSWKKLRIQFQERIARMRPIFHLTLPEDMTTIPDNPRVKVLAQATSRDGSRFQPVNLVEDNDRGVDYADSKTEPSTPTANGRDHVLNNKRNRPPSPYMSSKKPKVLKEADYEGCTPREFSLLEVRTAIEEISDGNMPDEVDPQVMKELSKQALAPWKHTLDVFRAAIMNLMCDTISKTLAEVFACCSRTALYTAAMSQINGFFNEIMTLQEKRLDNILKLETKDPTTLNKDAYKKNLSKLSFDLRSERRNIRLKAHFDREEEKTQKYTYDKQRATLVMRYDDNILGADPFETDLNVMAKVGGYYLTTYPRFVDNVILSVQVEMFEDITTKIHGCLQKELRVAGLRGNDRCRSLMDEQPDVANQRMRLQDKKKRLDSASDRLKKLASDSEVGDRYINQLTEEDTASKRSLQNVCIGG